MLPAADFRRSYPTANRHALADAAATRQLPLLLLLNNCRYCCPSLQMRAMQLLLLPLTLLLLPRTLLLLPRRCGGKPSCCLPISADASHTAADAAPPLLTQATHITRSRQAPSYIRLVVHNAGILTSLLYATATPHCAEGL